MSVPEVPLDWLRMHLQTARNQAQWARRPPLQEWLARSRLEAYAGLLQGLASEADPALVALQSRLRAARAPGLARMAELLDAAGAADGPATALARAISLP